MKENYRCESCGRLEESENGPVKCFCRVGSGSINLMKPVKEKTDDDEVLSEYLIEG